MPDKDHHTIQDAIHATANMTSKERLALLVKIEPISRNSHFSSPGDLLHEVLSRLCSGSRHWPKGLDYQAFILGAARSIANSDRRRAERSAYSIEELMDWEAQGREGPSSVLMEICKASSTQSAEDDAIGRERIRIVAELNVRASATLAKDALAKRAAEGYLEGLTPAEIAEELDIDPNTMRAADQRAWRAFMRAGKEMGLGTIHGSKQ
ncbi:RNA polymerase sigma factor [Acidovorax soli]|uniref:DNA-directed RNA polymerase specialized sigma subunit, sigma24 family n=1 Tax=Acidovorax soli TaxID=592050 RepID=A0A1H4EXG6_9BURK|nr:sigma-70 family RNA polymerase sigma factor [Acidovorax soli]SEA89649.1 DNA-directed RNA polymerase specialized sigma subunit, sigma24 family [Acidovorax soli]